MEANKTTYKYITNKSIVFGLSNDYELAVGEYYAMYNFYVTHSLLESGVFQHYSYIKYGWNSELYSKNGIKALLKNVLDLESDKFKFEEEYNDISKAFKEMKLEDNTHDFSFERGVIGKISENNQFNKILRVIRDSLVHGTYALKLCNGDKMIVMQDQNDKNVTGRLVLKLQTLLDIIRKIDKANIISNKTI